MSLSLRGKVARFAVFTRIALFILQVILNYLMPDHKPDVFNPPSNENKNAVDRLVELLFSGFRRWDAVYFLHIAQYGYTYQNCLVFFPALPGCIFLIANSILYPLQFVMAYSNVLLISAFFINLFCFVKATEGLYELGLKVLNNDALAYKGALFFCINPASVFMSAAYSESMFAFLTFHAMLKYENKNYLMSSILCGFSAFTRSNGLLTLGVVMYRRAQEFIRSLFTFIGRKDGKMFNTLIFVSTVIFFFVPMTIVYFIICTAFYAGFQYYAYLIYCTDRGNDLSIPDHIRKYGVDRGYVMPSSDTPDWCDYDIPNSYAYIQAQHWGVGFMRYYTVKQIPNFILAFPIVLISVIAAVYFIKKNSFYFVTLGMLSPERYTKKDDDIQMTGFRSINNLIYVLHIVLLVSFGVGFVHIQVLTRMLCSSSPVIYWFVAHLTTPNSEEYDLPNKYDVMKQSTRKAVETKDNINSLVSNLLTNQISDWQTNSVTSKLLMSYFLVYFVIGTAAHTNFLPWT